jgi:hypothetical protein
VGLAFGFASWWFTTLYTVTSTVTFLMVFLIQHNANRESHAALLKLNIHAVTRAHGGEPRPTQDTRLGLLAAGAEHPYRVDICLVDGSGPEQGLMARRSSMALCPSAASSKGSSRSDTLPGSISA